MSNGNGKLISNQRTCRRKEKSQIEEYLDFYGGPEYTYCNATDDIIKTISQLKARGRIFVCLLIHMRQPERLGESI
jgi:4-hydroxyphenylpyruvate dioxygenase-like putative hemolysin